MQLASLHQAYDTKN